jgi:hypothetical protein
MRCLNYEIALPHRGRLILKEPTQCECAMIVVDRSQVENQQNSFVMPVFTDDVSKKERLFKIT